MSSDSSPFSVSLQDLKLWQGRYDNLVQLARNGQTSISTETDGQVAPPSCASHSPDPQDWDRRPISPPKSFTKLLEEKLADETPSEVVDVPKKPFLRKGQGLARFRMKPNVEGWKPPKKMAFSNGRQSGGKSSVEDNGNKKRIEVTKTTKNPSKPINNQQNVGEKGILKKTNFSITNKAKNDQRKKSNLENATLEGANNKNLNNDNDLNLLKYLRTPQNDEYNEVNIPKHPQYLETYEDCQIKGRQRKLSFTEHLEQQLKELEIDKNADLVESVVGLKPQEYDNLAVFDREYNDQVNRDSNNLKRPFLEIDLTHLTIPDVVKYKASQNYEKIEENKSQESLINRGTWHDVLSYENNGENLQKITQDVRDIPEIDSININSDQDSTSGSTVLDHLLRQLNNEELDGLLANKVNFLAMKHFLMEQATSAMITNQIPQNISDVTTETKLKETATKPDTSEKELRIFEELEKRTENSSFSSTNTSIVNLLSSTPQRNRFISKNVQDPIPEDFPMPYAEENYEDEPKEYVDLQQRVTEINKKTKVLENFLLNLKHIEKGKNIRRRHSDSVSSVRRRRSPSDSTLTSFSDEERWSTRSSSPNFGYSRTSPVYTTLDSSYQTDTLTTKVADMGVNTSFDRLDETIKEEGCAECDLLRSKVSSLKKELDEEHGTLQMRIKDFEKKQSRHDRDVKSMEKKHERELEKIKTELENERKKFAKEKMVFETYVKEAQNRPNKKEREEITQLKQELADAKELIKLKESKNGSTQARLRNQIKQLEKEVGELQATVEKLQKENAKLSANQKLNVRPRPSEMKMLHEINKNITKLTEETLRKQAGKIINLTGQESGDAEIVMDISRRKSRDKSLGKENVEVGRKTPVTPKDSHQKRKSLVERARQKEDSACSDSTTFEISSIENIERQYENVFGNFDSPIANTSSSTDKTERTLEDGSMEIRYSNGNIKTISPDGNIIKVKYFNGDLKETNIQEQLIKYYYSKSGSWHIQFGDGTEVFECPDGQKSKKYKDGKIEISYPDGSFGTIHPDGTEEKRFPDGSRTVKKQDGEQILYMPNGQKEIHTKTHKRREYPDGTIRTLHKDGTIETIYANGRVRIKDPDGVLIMDTHAPQDPSEEPAT